MRAKRAAPTPGVRGSNGAPPRRTGDIKGFLIFRFSGLSLGIAATATPPGTAGRFVGIGFGLVAAGGTVCGREFGAQVAQACLVLLP